LARGGHDGKPLSPRTVGHAHRVLHRGLARAVAPPKVEDVEPQILTADQIAGLLAALRGYGGRYGWLPLHALATVALGTGMRRGEILGLSWGTVDLERGTIRVDRSLEETRAGLRLKSPKTRSGRRTIAIGAAVVDVLRDHRRRLGEHRLALGLGRLAGDDIVFPDPDGNFLSPDRISRAWGHAMRDKGLPRVSFHSLRHSSASALIAAGFDPVTVSRRLGHANPAVTLRVYSHRFSAAADSEAAQALDGALGAK
jgi:integrase